MSLLAAFTGFTNLHLAEDEEGILVVTLNRPAKRNALDDEISRQMREKKKKPATKRQAVAKLEGMCESMVKKRLSKVYREDISGCGGGKAEKDAVLDYLYDETMAHYRSILGKRRKSARSGGQISWK